MTTGEDRAENSNMRRNLIAVASSAGLLAALLFVGFPELDLLASGAFYAAGSGFLFRHSGGIEALRSALDLLFWAICLASLAGLLFWLVFRKPLFGQGVAQWSFMVLLLIVGPGLIANVLFKDHWGRARPDDIVAFGGDKVFTPALARSDQCTRNCSFLAGEVSSVFAAGLGIAMLRRRRRTAYVAAGALGALAALVRIGQGAHFLSDAVFAGVFMTITAVGVHWLVFGLTPAILRRPEVKRALAALQQRVTQCIRWGFAKGRLRGPQ